MNERAATDQLRGKELESGGPYTCDFCDREMEGDRLNFYDEGHDYQLMCPSCRAEIVTSAQLEDVGAG